MNKILELSIMLVIIMVFASLATGFSPKENFATIDDANRVFTQAGLTVAGGCPDSVNKGYVSLSPNLMDLFASGYVKKELVAGLQGANNIYTRSCTAPNSESCPLSVKMDSNKTSCTVEMNGQNYKLLRTCVNLTVDVSKSSWNYISIKKDKQFEKFILSQPVFFHVGRSRAYSINYGQGPNNQLVVRNFSLKGIARMDTAVQAYEYIYINQVRDSGSQVFGANIQTEDIRNVLKTTKTNMATITGNTDSQIVTLPFIIYYMDITPDYANMANLGTQLSMNLNDMPYFANMFSKVKNNKVTNPAFTIRFTFKMSRDVNIANANNWMSLLTVANRDVDSWCNHDGRGILLVEAEPWSFRRHNLTGVYEKNGKRNDDVVALDFAGVEKANNSNYAWCGWYNRLRVFLPVDVDIDIAYIVSNTMKVVVATYYDKMTNEKKYVYVHQNNCSQFQNEVANTVKRGNVYVKNSAKQYFGNLGDGVKVSNVQVLYGVDNLHLWFNS